MLLFCTVLTGAPLSSAGAALLPDVLPGDKFVLGSAIGILADAAVAQAIGAPPAVGLADLVGVTAATMLP